MFPTINILDFINNENFAFTKNFDQCLVKIVGIFCTKA